MPVWTAIALAGGLLSAPPTPSPSAEAILAMERRFSETLLARDEAAHGSLLADDLVHVGFEGQIAGKAEYMGFFRHGNWKYSRYEPSDVSVKILGECAVVTGRVRRAIVIDRKETVGAFAFTHVWVRSGGRWKLSSSHVTRVPEKTGGRADPAPQNGATPARRITDDT